MTESLLEQLARVAHELGGERLSLAVSHHSLAVLVAAGARAWRSVIRYDGEAPYVIDRAELAIGSLIIDVHAPRQPASPGEVRALDFEHALIYLGTYKTVELRMPIDFERSLFVRQYRDEQGSFRALPVLAKAVAAYLRILVDPLHGWLPLRGDDVATAVRKQMAGMLTRSEYRIIARSVGELFDEGYLVRCRVLESELGVITTHDQREVALSPWLEDPDGDWLVIQNWVPAQQGLNREDARSWHDARRERAAACATTRQNDTAAHAAQ